MQHMPAEVTVDICAVTKGLVEANATYCADAALAICDFFMDCLCLLGKVMVGSPTRQALGAVRMTGSNTQARLVAGQTPTLVKCTG